MFWDSWSTASGLGRSMKCIWAAACQSAIRADISQHARLALCSGWIRMPKHIAMVQRRKREMTVLFVNLERYHRRAQLLLYPRPAWARISRALVSSRRRGRASCSALESRSYRASIWACVYVACCSKRDDGVRLRRVHMSEARKMTKYRSLLSSSLVRFNSGRKCARR